MPLPARVAPFAFCKAKDRGRADSGHALAIACDAGVKGTVYLSVIKCEAYADVPHFAGKLTVDRMILRPAYFIQNDLSLKEALSSFGVYGMPIGSKGISMVDIRDIGEAAAIGWFAANGLPRRSAVRPMRWSARTACIWSEALGRAVGYGGDDRGALEQRLKTMLPARYALDLCLMFSRYQTDGAAATADDIARLTSDSVAPRAPTVPSRGRDAASQWTKS